VIVLFFGPVFPSAHTSHAQLPHPQNISDKRVKKGDVTTTVRLLTFSHLVTHCDN
jgi:hypothetical protein